MPSIKSLAGGKLSCNKTRRYKLIVYGVRGNPSNAHKTWVQAKGVGSRGTAKVVETTF
jgi:hypothetical protein